ncbi:MAG: MaoC family dehydratase N-terminal domain-containing protein [Erythrobacter sp.]
MSGEFDAWIGREARAVDTLDASLSKRWLATFNRELDAESPLPQGVHFALCTPEAATENLGPDGHPSRALAADSFMPPIPEDTMPRRMWASSKIAFHAPIAVEAKIERTSRIASIKEKSGGSGNLIFVDVDHATHADGTLAVEETQTLVYRAAAPADAPLSPPALGEGVFDPSEWGAHRAITPDPRLLFRYSALTFNTHRIHYDAPYAEAEERYRGLVVHGPLTASLLLQLAARELGENALKTFNFRGVSPAIADEPLHLVMRGSGSDIELGAFADDGREVMAASATA